MGAFYSGVTSTMVGQAAIKGVVFWSYGVAQRLLEAEWGVAELGPWGLFLAACLSGLLGSFVVTPVERVKCVMQAAKVRLFLGARPIFPVLSDDGAPVAPAK